MKLSERANKLKKDIPAVFLALKDSKTPKCAKIFAFITVVYALSPVDLIPDFIPVLGLLDDVIILPALIALTLRSIPPAQLVKYRELSESMWKDGRPKRWYYALPFIMIWLFVILLVIKVVFL